MTLSRRDFDALQRWPRLDMTRLLVVGEDALHVRRINGTGHPPQSLDALLATLKAPVGSKAPLAPAEAPIASAGEPRPGGLLDHFAKTGNIRRMPKPQGKSLRLPTVYVNGQPVLLTRNTVEVGRVKVAVTA